MSPLAGATQDTTIQRALSRRLAQSNLLRTLQGADGAASAFFTKGGLARDGERFVKELQPPQ